MSYKPLPGLKLQAGYGAFVPARAAQRIAGSARQHFAWLWLGFDIDYPIRDDTE